MVALLNVKTIVCHKDCPDGVASALILRDVFPDARVCFVQHGTAELCDFPAEPGQLWCDIVPPRDRAQSFVTAGAIVLDHHKGAAYIVALFGDRGVFADENAEPGVSGAMLAFREVWRRVCQPSATESEWMVVQDFATLAGIRDTWQRQSPRWEDACAQAAALRFWPVGDILRPLPDGRTDWPNVARKMEIGPVLIAKDRERDDRTISEALRFEEGGVRVLCFEGHHTSDISDRLWAEIDLVMGWRYYVDAGAPKVAFSLRSRGGFSAADFAKRFGGGGHTQAAGFTLDLPSVRVPPLSADPYSAAVDLLRLHLAGGR
jgi:hypothetical protein